MFLAIIVLLIVFLLIAFRQVGKFKIQIWQAMLLGALAVLLTAQISLPAAWNSINWDVMLFLFGMFIVGRALEQSGYLSRLSYKLFHRANSADALVLTILFGMGIASAFLLNDTIAIIGTPVILLLAKSHAMKPKLLLLALAFAITIGSVMSPIGNPQNVLIAVNGNIPNAFVTFFSALWIPTVLNLLIAFALLKLFYAKEFHSNGLNHEKPLLVDENLAFWSKVSLALIVLMVFAKIALSVTSSRFDFPLTYIAIAAAAPIVLFSGKRVGVLKRIDWKTLVFFASMFVLMESVWLTGFFQNLIQQSAFDVGSTPVILAIGIVVSQFLSNVPLVALYLPLLVQHGATTTALLALAVGSTIAGNLFILGAASNVIIIQNAEKSGETITFWEFTKIGIPLTLLNAIVYWTFLSAL